MMEPARADRYVGFAWPPDGARDIAMLQRAHDLGAADAWDLHDTRVDGGPIGVAGQSILIANPANVGSGVGEHHRIWLEPPHQSPDSRPIVDLLLAIRPFAIGAVEPDLVNR